MDQHPFLLFESNHFSRGFLLTLRQWCHHSWCGGAQIDARPRAVGLINIRWQSQSECVCVQKYLYLTLMAWECPDSPVKALLWASLCPDEKYCASAVFVLELQINARWAFLQWFLNLYLHWTFVFLFHWNRNVEMDIAWWIAGRSRVCVCLSDRWRVKDRGCDWVPKGQLNREPSICENTGDFFTTHTQLWFWRTIYYTFHSDVLRGYQTQALFTVSEISHHKINRMSFKAWFWINETKTVNRSVSLQG